MIDGCCSVTNMTKLTNLLNIVYGTSYTLGTRTTSVQNGPINPNSSYANVFSSIWSNPYSADYTPILGIADADVLAYSQAEPTGAFMFMKQLPNTTDRGHYMYVSTDATITQAGYYPQNAGKIIPAFNAAVFNDYLCNNDTDGDGIPNRLDLDSDGDGCPDAKEAGVSSNAGTSASMSASGGSIYTGGIPSGTANAYVGNGTPSQYNANGFFNGIETAAESGVYNGIYAYSFATSAVLNLCIDTDADGVGDFVDIDDDNDGVVDAVESPSCFYTSSEWNTGAKPFYGVTISSGLTTTTGNFSQLIDGVSGITAVAFSASPTQTVANANVYLFNFAHPVKLDALYLQFNTATQFGGTTKIQGSNTNNGSDWVNLSADIAATAPTNTTTNGGVSVTTSIKYPVTLNTGTAYKYIRITGGTTASNIVAANASEVYFDFNNASYIASSYPKTTCVSDTDGDGIRNHLDLDSDGDGCPDAVEASVSANPGAAGVMSTSGGSIYTGGIPSGTANAYVGNGTPAQYGSNGLFSDIETGENGIYNGIYTYPFAVSTVLNLCADSDGDGIGNLVDIDDDNDGVVDAVESPNCFYTANEWNTNAKPFYGVTISSGLTTTTGNFSQLIDGVNNVSAVAFSAVPTQAIQNANVYLFNFAQPVKLNALYLQFNTATQFGGTTKIQGSNTNNGSDWVDLSAAIGAGAGPNTTANGGVSVATSIKYPVTLNTATAYKYIRITGVAASNIVAANASEVYFDFNNTSYVASQYPKIACINDIDGDGIVNHLDLDSDGDGCSDALESGATTITTANYQFTGNVGTNGLVNSLETVADNGSINYTSTYNAYALISAINACTDTDGDGIRDIIDIDDDNDGVLDTVEGLVCPSLNISCDNATANYKAVNWTSFNATTNTAVGSVVLTNGETVTVNYSGDVRSLQASGALANATEYCPTSTSSGSTNMIQTFSGVGTVHKFVFSKPVLNPIFQIWSLGAGGSPVTYQFTTDVAILKSNAALTQPNSNTITGAEGNGSVVFAGSQTEISFVANALENWSGLTLAFGFTASDSGGCSSIDTDGDGIPNHLDLDSDGDGCPDAKEASVSVNTGASASMSTSGGAIYTGGIPSGTANAYVGNGTPSQYGTNGFFNGIETAVDSNLYNSTYTYQYAINNTLNACTDTDGDGVGDLIDIDDDNDGILDITEAQCATPTYTSKSGVTVSSTITWNGALSLLVDGADTANQTYPNGAAIAAQTVLQFDLPSAKALKQIELSAYLTHTAIVVGAVVQMQGWNGVSWENIGSQITVATPTTGIANPAQLSYKFSMPANLFSFTKYRIYGVSGNVQANWLQEAYFSEICVNNDTDGDGIPNILDLDSDGDGCPDAVEAGVSTNSGASASMSTSGSGIYTGGVPSGTANAYVGNGTPAQYGSNGFFNGIETAVDNGIYNGSYTYSLYALSLGQNVCTDTDGDNVPDIFDIDDDNDGVLDKVECPTLFTNMATGGGFSTDAAALPNWYTATASATLPIAEPFTPTVITFSNPMGVANYGIGGGNQVNSQLTGGLFDSLDGSNTATGVQYVLQEGDPQHPIVNKLSTPLVAGVPYNYSFDLGNRASGSATKYIVMLYNADTKMAEKIITSGALNTIPAVGATPSYKNFTGSFIPASSANYYLLFYPSVSGNTESDFVIDRVAVAGAGAGACDIDNDGIPNYLDLDSDGDGCPDTKEAILYNHATEASIAGDVKNGSGGVVTSTVNTPNAMVPGPYGNNGFADALQSASNPDAYKYVYTYLFVATDANVSTCDNKFLYDIDSDDDGIPDAVESPSCFYTEAQAMDITEGVTSDFGWTIANPLSKTYDDITLATNYGEISAPTATSIQNKALITFDLPVIDAAFINSITLNVGLSFGAGKWKLQGLNMMTNVWTDLSAAAGQALGAGTIVFNNTLQNNTRYHSYRIIGVDNINIANAARLIEFSIQYKNYNASYHRTKMGCSSDADGDGVPNYIDRDSDGDGCPDAVEAGIPLSKLVPGDFFNTGGTVSGAHVTVGGNYGDNGLGDDVETAPDSGIVNYTSTYTQYATNKTLNFCTDTDGDSVPDLIDLDDDNDGILDTTECVYPAIPTTTSTADIFATWSNTTTAAGTNGAPTYLTSVGSWTAGAGLTAAISGGAINISNVNGSTLGDAFGANEYLEHPFTTTADNYNSLYYIRSSASNATNYHWAMLISDDNFVTYTILNIDMLRNATGVAINDINDYQLKPSTAYKVRTYYWGAPAFTFDEFTMFGYSECDTDSDGVPNRLDLDSDGDGCPDAKESGVAANSGATASMSSSGGSIYTGGIASGTAEAYVGNGTPAQYGNNGFFNGIETAAESGLYNGTYTYASAINATISACFCYKPAITAGTVLDTHQGITSLQRAGTDNSDWPMVRKGAWTALESKTKAFVPNRLTITEINSIPVENLKEGMMVYNISSNCIYINTDGTASGWKCFNTQACP